MSSTKNPLKTSSDKKTDPTVRLNKLLAERGLASRRGADKLIADGLVMVNGKKVYELGVKVNPNKDRITVDGKPIKSKTENLYIMFNKPKNVITSMSDPLERPTVADYMAELPVRVFPIGRLDWDSEGLLLLTNDGDFAQRVMHPKTEVTKTYHVKLDGQPLDYQIKKLLTGVSIPGGRVKAKHVEKLKQVKSKSRKTSEKHDWYKIIITEGKNHQVREMFKKIGFDVLKLHRVAIGKLRIGQLDRGEMVFLNEAAASRVFLQDLPEEAHGKRDVRHKSKKTPTEKTLTKKKFNKVLNKKD